MIRSWDDILAWWPGPAELSKALAVPYQTANSMLRRRSVHSRNWGRLIEAAAEKGEVLSAEQLVALADGREPEPQGSALAVDASTGPRRQRNSQKRNKGVGH
jgi:hypothetical protein